MQDLPHAASTDGWEDWMLEFEHGVCLVLPPPALGYACDALRRRYDPTSAAICQSHVTLTSPFPRPLRAADLDELRDAVGAVAPFEVLVGPPTVPEPHAGVILAVGPVARFTALRDAAHAVAAFDGVAHRRLDVPPHLTIAEFVTLEASRRIRDELVATAPGGTFLCDAVAVAVPDADFRVEPVARLALGVT